MNVIVFNIFFILHLFIGRGFFLFLRKVFKINLKIENIGISSFSIYPIVSIFLIGNLNFIFNFFFPVDSLLYLYLFFALCLVIFNFTEKVIFSYKSQPLVILLISSILSISSFGMRLHYDAGLYHLTNQLWIKENRVIFGIVNVHNRLAFSSIQEYISSSYWLDGNFLLLHFINVLFFIFLFNFLFENIFINKNFHFLKASSICIVFLGFLDNFGFNGGGNGHVAVQTVGKADANFAIIFLITSLLIINSLIINKYTLNNLLLFSYLALFCLQLRLTGALMTFLLSIYLANVIKINQLSIYKILKKSKLLLTVFSLWLLKNIFLSGCLIFPVSITCYKKLSWYTNELLILSIQQSKGFYRALSFEKGFSIWYQDWINTGFNKQISINLFFSLIALFIVMRLLSVKNPRGFKINILFYLFLLLNFILWITNSPGVRFAYGFIMLISVSTVLNRKLRIDNKILNYILLFIFIGDIFLFPRLYSYKEFLNNYQNLTVIEVPVKNISFEKKEWGYQPVSGDQCWDNKECTPSKDIKPPLIKNGYYFFIPELGKKN